MIFAVFGTENQPAIKESLGKHFAGEFYEVATGQFFVRAEMTSKEVSDRLGVTDNTSGNAVIVSVSSYYGRQSNQLWEWLRLKWED